MATPTDARTNTVPAAPAKKPCGCPESKAAFSRRNFLKGTAAGIVAGIATETLATRFAFASAPYDGDVLFILSLRGGMDGLNVIVPAGDPDYAALRPGIEIPQGALIPLEGIFGMHPAMAPLQPFWNAGTFGVVHAVGMAEPNRSHFEAMEELERAAPKSSVRTGWLDRVLTLRDETTAFQGTQMGSDMAASAFLGPSPELAMYSIDGFGLDGANDSELGKWDSALRGLHTDAPGVLSTPAFTALDALATVAALKATPYQPANGAVYPQGSLGDAMQDVARLIKGNAGLQVAAVDYGDWDMHADEGAPDNGWMFDHLTELSSALAAFATDLGPQLNDVTLVTLTEFGRRAEENGSYGTDHGYGQAVLMLGGGVAGGHVHVGPTWPGLAPADLIDGDLNGRNDYRVLLAEVLQDRCRASASDIASIFPNLPSGDLGVTVPRPP